MRLDLDNFSGLPLPEVFAFFQADQIEVISVVLRSDLIGQDWSNAPGELLKIHGPAAMAAAAAVLR